MRISDWTNRARTFAHVHWIGLAVTAGAVAIYALLGFLLVPKLVRSALNVYATQTLHRRVELADFTFKLGN